MKKLFVMAASSLAAASAFAAPTCTAPEEKWLSEIYLEAELQAQGYQVESVKISAGKCYEFLGRDKDGKQVVVYMNPETADVLEKK